MIYVAAPSFFMNLTSNTILCQQLTTSTAQSTLAASLDAASSTPSNGQALFLNLTNPQAKANVYSNFNNISSCQFDSGNPYSSNGVFYIANNLNMRDTGSQYDSNSAVSGGIFYCDGCNLYSTQSMFSNNVCKQGCVAYYRADQSKLQSASQTSNTVQITHSSFVNNYARRSASGLYISSAPSSTQGLFGRQVSLKMSQTTFNNNSADFGQGGIFYLNSDQIAADISSSNFSFNRMNFQNYSGSDAAIFYLGQRAISRFNLSSSTFLFDSPISFS